MQPTADWSLAPLEATHALTTGDKWTGSPELKGTVEFVTQKHSVPWAPLTHRFIGGHVLGDSSWVVLEARPVPQIELCCSTVCDKVLLEKELKVKGARELYEELDFKCFDSITRADLQSYIDYVMHEE